MEQRDKRVLNIKEIQKFKDQLLDEIQDTFSDKKNPTLLEYQQQTENLITLKELLEREKESMPQENFDLISGQDFVILQIERWIDENNELLTVGLKNPRSRLKSISFGCHHCFAFLIFLNLFYLSGSSYRQRQPG